MVYFISDLHIGHTAVIKAASRPFSSTEEMNETIVSKWNAKVKGGDTVYILGDMFYNCKNPTDYLDRLKGKKVLVVGNHDHGWLETVDKNKYFLRVETMIEQSLSNRMVTLCHYPLLEWRGSRKALDCKRLGYLIYGHVHVRCDQKYIELYKKPHALNAGVDVNNFEPVTMEELIENNKIHKQKMLEMLAENKE